MSLLNLTKYLLAFGIAFVIADLITRYLLLRCNQRKILDMPGERRLHAVPVPRLGGVAVFLSFILTSLALVALYGNLFRDGVLGPVWILQFLMPATILLVVGVCDDLYQLSPFVKLFGQIIAASLLILLGNSIGSVYIFSLHPVLDFSLTLFWFLLIINAFNLIDGLDGLAGGLAIIAAAGLVGISLISNEVFSVLIILSFIGAVGGFLVHNFHPAKIFLGDSGSMFIGFALAAFTLCSPSKGSTVATLAASVLALGVPLLDTMLAVWRRSIRSLFSQGKGVMKADMDHLHHRLIKRGFNQRRVALSLYALSAILVGIGLLSLLFSSYSHGIYLIAFTFGTYLLLRHLASVELWDSGAAIMRGVSKPTGPMITAWLYPLVDVFVLSCALFFALKTETRIDSWADFRELLVAFWPVWIGIPFVAMGSAGGYKRVWSKARISEYVYFLGAFLFGAFLSAGMTHFLGARGEVEHLSLFTLLYIGFGGGGIVFVRAAPRMVIDLMFINAGLGSQERKVLVLGADILYLRNLKEGNWLDQNSSPFRIIGLVDADRYLRKRIVHGYPVLGTVKELPRILSEHTIHEMVITPKYNGSEQERRELLELSRAANIVLKEWRVLEQVLLHPMLDERVDASREIYSARST